MVAYDENGNAVQESSSAPLVAGAALGAGGLGYFAYRHAGGTIGGGDGHSSFSHPQEGTAEAKIAERLQQEFAETYKGRGADAQLKKLFTTKLEGDLGSLPGTGVMKDGVLTGHEHALGSQEWNQAETYLKELSERYGVPFNIKKVEGNSNMVDIAATTNRFMKDVKSHYRENIADIIKFDPSGMHREHFLNAAENGQWKGNIGREIAEQMKQYHPTSTMELAQHNGSWNVSGKIWNRYDAMQINSAANKLENLADKIEKEEPHLAAQHRAGAGYLKGLHDFREKQFAYIKNNNLEHGIEIPEHALNKMRSETLAPHAAKLEQTMAHNIVETKPFLLKCNVTKTLEHMGQSVQNAAKKVNGHGMMAKVAIPAAIGGLVGAWALNTTFGKNRATPQPPQQDNTPLR